MTITGGEKVGPGRVFLVDDEEDVHSRVQRLFRKPWYDLEGSTSPMGATSLIRAFQPHVVILDLMMPGCPGPALFKLIQPRVARFTKVVLFSSHDDGHLMREMKDLGADGWAPKGDLLRLEKIVRELSMLSRLEEKERNSVHP